MVYENLEISSYEKLFKNEFPEYIVTPNGPLE